MLRAIRKFAFRRGRGAGQGSEGLVEKDNAVDQGNTFDDLLQSTRQEIEEPSGPPVRGRVKWFSPIKGYGFVVLSDGSGDVFLHASALAGIGITTLQPGETLEFRVALGQRGPQVAEVISVDSSTAASPRPSRRSFGSPSDRQPLQASVQEVGTVKWYNATRGFGFIVLEGGGKEVLIGAGQRRERADAKHLARRYSCFGLPPRIGDGPLDFQRSLHRRRRKAGTACCRHAEYTRVACPLRCRVYRGL